MKKIKARLKLMIMGGGASPAPPIGPALAPYGINLQEFCKKFNEITGSRKGILQRAQITLFEDRTFDLLVKDSPVVDLLKKMAKIEKGSGNVVQSKSGKITAGQIIEIAKQKSADFNTDDLPAAVKMVSGTARSLGLTIEK